MKQLFRSMAGAVLLLGMPLMAADAPPVDIKQVMLTQVNPQGLALWDITNEATGDDGRIDARKLSPAQWAALLKIGQSLQDGGQKLATKGGIRAAAPGVKLQSEGEPNAAKAADVDRWIKARPAKFRALAQGLQQTGAGVVDAATRRDVKKLGDLSGKLDEVCEACHTAFWYPNQVIPK